MNGEAATTAPQTASRIARLARLCAFALPLILAIALLGVKSAQAAALQPAVISFAVDAAEDEELAFEEEEEEALDEESEAEFAEAECEIAEEEFEEGFLTPADVAELCAEADAVTGGASSKATNKCPIRSIRAHAARRNDRLKLTIGYTTTTPTKATIQIPKVGTYKRKLGRSGVIRIARKLGKRQPRRVVVRVKAPSCAKPTVSTTRVR